MLNKGYHVILQVDCYVVYKHILFTDNRFYMVNNLFIKNLPQNRVTNTLCMYKANLKLNL